MERAPQDDAVTFEGLHCKMEIRRPARDLVVVTISGTDTGELQDAPFQEMQRDLTRGEPLELFIDARDTRGASIGVSNDWALWLRRHRACFEHVTMLTGSRFIQLTADFVRRFSEMGDLMRVTTDPAAFDEALETSVRRRSAS